MTNEAQARYTRNESLESFFESNSTAYTADAAMKAAVTAFKADSATAIASSIIAETDNKGYSAEKFLSKETASNTAADLCANCQVKLDLLGKITISQSIYGISTYYSHVSDALCTSRLLSVHSILLANLSILTPDYLTEVQLTAFLGQINSFTGLRGSSSFVLGGETVATKQAESDLKVTNADVISLKKVGRKYKTSNPTFYNGLMQACKIPTITVRHTPVILTVIDSVTKLPIGNVTSTLSKSKGLLVSNPEGIVNHSNVSAGNAISTLAKQGYISKLTPIKVLRGQTNAFTIALTPGTMTAEQIAAFKLSVAESIAAEKAATAAKTKSKKAAKIASAAAIAIVKEEIAADSTPQPTSETGNV